MNDMVVLDNGGVTHDRYAVVYLNRYTKATDMFVARFMSAKPGQRGEFNALIDVSAAWIKARKGSKIAFNQLPPVCQTVVSGDTL